MGTYGACRRSGLNFVTLAHHPTDRNLCPARVAEKCSLYKEVYHDHAVERFNIRQ